MKKAFTFLIFSFSIFVMQAQDYSLFQTGQKSYFRYSPDYNYQNQLDCDDCYFGASADSFAMVGNDKQIFHTNTFRWMDMSDSCLQVRDTSWVGIQTIQKSNGDFYFFNINADTILIKSQAHVGDTWNVYHFANGNYIEATLQYISFQNVLDVTDSVKVMVFQVKDSLNHGISHHLNGKHLKVSKKYGMVTAPNFLHFPNDETFLELSGHSALNGVYRNITWADIYDFNIGDEFHTLERYFPVPDVARYTYVKKIVTSRQTSPFHISYDFDVEEVIIFEDNGTTTRTYSSYTKVESYPLTHFSDGLLPYQSYSFMPDSTYHMDMFTNGFSYSPTGFYGQNINGRMVKSWSYGWATYSRYKCTPTFICGYGDEQQYIEGAGGPYHYSIGFDPESYYLKYFKKGTETWGTPFNIPLLASASDVKTNNRLQIAPNPTSNHLQITTTKTVQNGQIQIFNTAGKLIFSKNINAENQWRLDVSNYPTGIYILKMQTKEGVWSSKFIKQ